MRTEHGLYTISGSICYDRPATEKAISIPDMPSPQNAIECENSRQSVFRVPTSRKGKIALTTDFLITICGAILFSFTVVVIIALIEFGVFPQHRSGFYCNDPKIAFSFQGDTVSMGTLLVTVYLGPLFLICVVEAREGKRCINETMARIWWWYKEFLLGMTVTLVITEFAKIVVGEPRPHFLDTCRPDTAVNCTLGYIPYYTCTNRHVRSWLVLDSAKSFPSGHSSLSVFAALFCTWYIQRRLSPTPCKLTAPVIQTLCLVGCVTCSLSRIADRRHHWWDVLAGAVLGAVCAIYTVVVFCGNFRRPLPAQPRPSHSTCTLLTDTTNKHATSVVL